MRKTPNITRFLVIPAFFVLLLMGASSASAAQSGRERLAEPEIRVERTLKLRPQAGTEVKVSEFKALFLSDGSVSVQGQGTAVANTEPQGFDFEVDLIRGTYSTRRLDPQEIEERDRLRDELLGDREEEELPAPDTKAIMPGTRFARARVQTKDPVNILLAETMTSLTWSTSSTGTVTGISPSTDSCWAANPSSLGTHWFNSYCAYGALYLSSGRVCNSNSGDYYNYDFVFPDWITTASHYVYVCGRNDGTYNYNFTYTDGGEGSLLITGTLVLG